MPQSPNLPKEIEDAEAISEAVLKAAGSRLQHYESYSRERIIEAARLALRTIIAAAIAAQRGE